MRKITGIQTCEIVRLQSGGLSFREIAKILGISVGTVSKYLQGKRRKNEGKKPGRKQLLSSRCKKLILRNFEAGKLKNCTDAKKYLASVHQVKVSIETIRLLLHKLALKSYAKPRKPRLLPQHKKARRQFVRVIQTLPESIWKHAIFVDESKYNLFGPDCNKRVWRRQNSELQDWHIRQVIKFGGGSVMVWGSISWKGVGQMAFIDTKMNADVYKDVLSIAYRRTLEVHGYLVDNSFLVQDNDPKHASRTVQNWLEEHSVRAMKMPSCSPDLNPIEHVWNYVEMRIRERNIQPEKIDELRKAIQEEWYKVPIEYIQTLILSMSARIAAVKRARGGHTKY